jgi:cyclic pyranopterin monophosphate synthase
MAVAAGTSGADGPLGSSGTGDADESRFDALSHLDERGAAHMVDVTEKGATGRTAVAAGALRTTAHVVGLISTGGLPKGDALATARVAGILAAKRTSDLIPLCHQLALTGVDVDFVVGEADIEITATVRSTDRTGVEMEALTAVSVAALTLYDMIKAVDPAAAIDKIRVLRKEGGRHGTWTPP